MQKVAFPGHTLVLGKYTGGDLPLENDIRIVHAPAENGRGITSIAIYFDDRARPVTMPLEETTYNVNNAIARWQGILNDVSFTQLPAATSDERDLYEIRDAGALVATAPVVDIPSLKTHHQDRLTNHFADYMRKQSPRPFSRPVPRTGNAVSPKALTA